MNVALGVRSSEVNVTVPGIMDATVVSAASDYFDAHCESIRLSFLSCFQNIKAAKAIEMLAKSPVLLFSRVAFDVTTTSVRWTTPR